MLMKLMRMRQKMSTKEVEELWCVTDQNWNPTFNTSPCISTNQILIKLYLSCSFCMKTCKLYQYR